MSGPNDPEEIDMHLSAGDVERFRDQLLDWYDRHRRDLPWRNVEEPYGTWVAEIMLQQTRVETVVDYYRRWMERFPTLESVARADVDDVLDLWEGLGYYRRARYLHESAERILEEYSGEVPTTVEELEELPGIGPYTAGAIASIAFDRAVPVVDGNVSRVLSRLFAIEGDPTDRSNKKAYWSLAEEMVDPARPGDFNQALMELGSTVCTPQSPSCLLCPVREHCEAFASGTQDTYPDSVRRPPQRPVDLATCFLRAQIDDETAATYVLKRDANGLLGGLWEFPTVELEEGGSPEDRLDSLLGDTLDLPAAREADGEKIHELTHLFSHLRLSVDIHVRRLSDTDVRPFEPEVLRERGRGWVRVERLDAVPMSTAMRRVQRAVLETSEYESNKS